MFSPLHTDLPQPKLTAPNHGTDITPREVEILALLAQGLLNRDVARHLHISTETVKAHLRNVYKKTGSQNKIEALNKTRWLTASLPATKTGC